MISFKHLLLQSILFAVVVGYLSHAAQFMPPPARTGHVQLLPIGVNETIRSSHEIDNDAPPKRAETEIEIEAVKMPEPAEPSPRPGVNVKQEREAPGAKTLVVSGPSGYDSPSVVSFVPLADSTAAPAPPAPPPKNGAVGKQVDPAMIILLAIVSILINSYMR